MSTWAFQWKLAILGGNQEVTRPILHRFLPLSIQCTRGVRHNDCRSHAVGTVHPRVTGKKLVIIQPDTPLDSIAGNKWRFNTIRFAKQTKCYLEQNGSLMRIFLALEGFWRCHFCENDELFDPKNLRIEACAYFSQTMKISGKKLDSVVFPQEKGGLVCCHTTAKKNASTDS